MEVPQDSSLTNCSVFLRVFPPCDLMTGQIEASAPGKAASGWWLKFSLDKQHPLAWNVVQELAHVLNYLSVTEHLPTVFKPVSPPPYLNGGLTEFLSWMIECSNEMSPAKVAEWVEGRLPRPVDDLAKWSESSKCHAIMAQ